MELSKSKLKQIIKEEIQKSLQPLQERKRGAPKLFASLIRYVEGPGYSRWSGKWGDREELAANYEIATEDLITIASKRWTFIVSQMGLPNEDCVNYSPPPPLPYGVESRKTCQNLPKILEMTNNIPGSAPPYKWKARDAIKYLNNFVPLDGNYNNVGIQRRLPFKILDEMGSY